MNVPKPPTGVGALSAWCKQLLQAVRAQRLLPGRGYNLHRYPNGVVIDFPPGGTQLGTPASFSIYSFVSHAPIDPANPTAADYVMGIPLGADPTTPPVKILKPDLLWFSIQSRLGGIVTFSQWSSSAQSRVATNLIGSVIEYITPQYYAGDLLEVTTVDWGAGIGKVLTDQNIGGRVFAGPS